jgi:hypothetical protein
MVAAAAARRWSAEAGQARAVARVGLAEETPASAAATRVVEAEPPQVEEPPEARPLRRPLLRHDAPCSRRTSIFKTWS